MSNKDSSTAHAAMLLLLEKIYPHKSAFTKPPSQSSNRLPVWAAQLRNLRLGYQIHLFSSNRYSLVIYIAMHLPRPSHLSPRQFESSGLVKPSLDLALQPSTGNVLVPVIKPFVA